MCCLPRRTPSTHYKKGRPFSVGLRRRCNGPGECGGSPESNTHCQPTPRLRDRGPETQNLLTTWTALSGEPESSGKDRRSARVRVAHIPTGSSPAASSNSANNRTRLPEPFRSEFLASSYPWQDLYQQVWINLQDKAYVDSWLGATAERYV
jgi:hypothetical protein